MKVILARFGTALAHKHWAHVVLRNGFVRDGLVAGYDQYDGALELKNRRETWVLDTAEIVAFRIFEPAPYQDESP